MRWDGPPDGHLEGQVKQNLHLGIIIFEASQVLLGIIHPYLIAIKYHPRQNSTLQIEPNHHSFHDVTLQLHVISRTIA